MQFHVQNMPYPTLHECFFREASRGSERKLSHIIWRHSSFQFLLTWWWQYATKNPCGVGWGRFCMPQSHQNHMCKWAFRVHFGQCKRELDKRGFNQTLPRSALQHNSNSPNSVGHRLSGIFWHKHMTGKSVFLGVLGNESKEPAKKTNMQKKNAILMGELSACVNVVSCLLQDFFSKVITRMQEGKGCSN